MRLPQSRRTVSYSDGKKLASKLVTPSGKVQYANIVETWHQKTTGATPEPPTPTAASPLHSNQREVKILRKATSNLERQAGA